MVEHDLFGHARESGKGGVHPVKSIVLPPDETRPRTLGDEPIGENYGFARTGVPSKIAKSGEVGTLHRRVGPRIRRCGRQCYVRRRIRGGSNQNPRKHTVTVGDHLEPRKPPTRSGDDAERRVDVGVTIEVNSLRRGPSKEPFDVTVEADDGTVDDEKRVGNTNRAGVDVAPLVDDERVTRPAVNGRIAHSVKGMADRYVRLDPGVTVDAEAAFLALFSTEHNVFWLDDSLAETVSYLGIGVPVETTDGFTELTAPGECPVSRVGWISYGERESTLGVSVGIERHPRSVILDVSVVIEVDHRDGSTAVYARDHDSAHQWSDRVRSLAESPAAFSDPVPPPARTARWRDTTAEYSRVIETCLDRIGDGDAYQLCLTTAIEVPGQVDPVNTYRLLRRAAPTRHGGFLRSGDVTLLSSSPELFLTVRGRTASTKPIKGTRPRSIDPAEDLLLKRELLESDKERAENLMIVDLCRNDLSRVCETGTVHVPALHVVETYSTVHQLVSTVSGTLRADVSGPDAARALFPAGSMTGAPKHSSVEILSALETGERGMYSGVFGFAGRGDLTLAMTIRSIIVDPVGAIIGAGGGITASSVPLDEIHEVGVKADALLRVLGASPNLYLSAE